MKRVALVELSVFERITPLVSGYLQAYASMDQAVRSTYTFEKYTTSIKTPAEQVARDLQAMSADVYAFSCYVWNVGLVRTLAGIIRQAHPQAHILLGGPQVMHHGRRYLDPADDRSTVCNGEGEVTFTEYLRELSDVTPDLSRVSGLSFWRDGELITTEDRPRIKDLDTVPSPFLAGLFDHGYSMSILETNRGCPYHCGFCYWGAATNDRVYRFDEQRVRDEITWMARNDVMFLYIADANWGMLARDVDISLHIADCAHEYRLPAIVYYSAAKNKPHAVTKITSIFQNAGVVTSQPVSLQSIEPRALDLVARSNIRLDAFAAVQEDLREKGLSSFIELIWPLPGETLDSFRSGISTLCDSEAQAIIAYSHLLLNNTPIYHNRARLGLKTRSAGGGIAEARIVVATEEVSEAEFAEGMRYFYAVHALHNTRSLRATARYLTGSGIVTFRDLFSGLVDFWRQERAGNPIVNYVERSIRNAEFYDLNNYGLFIHSVLHAERACFADQMQRFVVGQPWWDDPQARLRYEIDLVNRPYVYSNTPLDPLEYPFEALRLHGLGSRHYTIEVPAEYLPVLAANVRVDGLPSEETGGRPGDFVALRVDHKRRQYPFMASQSMDHNGSYCHGMIERIENITPAWRVLSRDG
jgi:hypothetical protein